MAAAALWLSVMHAPAQAAVMLSGGLTHEHNISAGQQINGVLTLQNTDNAPAEIKLYQEDSSPEGADAAHQRSNKAWINLSTERVILPPGGSQNVTYTLNVPSNATEGSYWSMIEIEPVAEQSAESQLAQQPQEKNAFSVSVQQKVRYAVAVLANLGNGSANLTFAAPKVDKNAEGKRVFAMDITNTGNRYTRPNVSLEVFDNQGSEIASLKGESRGLVPAANKNFEIDISSLKPGNYKALLSAEDSNTGQVFGSDVSLTVQP
ncbi:MAG: hypothetical protein BWK73_37155 [Thiothrix lacustris]|uniref:DUF3324 domain-containing protein n=1 Tax=Thiothrix lacustris TaxID=525917 RepID=A0A1Y1QEZ3_9GAMM|nr:MAG: hypothetical protein BWK73_37155 [Thiothrix lacustris]